MIINSEGGVKQTIGQTTEYKTTIDIENLDFIATLLSSNLYSKPEESFIREIVSNGWDSHVEANNTDTPLIVRIKQCSSNNYDITIRDYGTGLSKENFENLYCKIGSSTKRLSNSYLGCFGLGHLSPLSVSEVVFITSHYNGISRLYVMTKDNNNITTNLMSEIPTDEHNGLEITIKNIKNILEYEKAFLNLAFFPNVYVEGLYAKTNSIKVKRFNYFTFANNIFEDKILLGNVLYPLNPDILPSELISFYNRIKYSGIVINFNIGELNVTPNRESIIYNSKTNELIINRLTKAKEEITSIVNNKIPDSVTNYRDFYEFNCCEYDYDFITETLQKDRISTYKFAFKLSDYKKILFHNKEVDFRIVGRFYNSKPTNIRAVIRSNSISTALEKWNNRVVIEDPSTNIIKIPKSQKLTKYIKEYLIQNYNKLIIVNEDCNYTNFRLKYIEDFVYTRSVSVEEEFVLTKVWEQWQNRFITIDFSADKNFLDFKDTYKELNKNPLSNTSIILTTKRAGAMFGTKMYRTNYDEVLKYIKSLNTGVIIRNLDMFGISGVASWLGYSSIAANQKVVKLLEKENLKCKITEEDIAQNPKVIRYNTFRKSGLFQLAGNDDVNFRRTLPLEFKNVIQEAKHMKASITYEARIWIEGADINIDEHLLNVCNTIIKYFEDYQKLINSLNVLDSSNIEDIINYLIVKNKLYRISYDCYKKIKANKIIQALCQK